VDALDVVLSLLVVGLAVVFLASRFRKPPACHDEGKDVQVGDALARGIERAKKRGR
jgi:hypothetical protein